MFVPVACVKCGKLFQVPAAAAGTDVPCPWCKATVPALPVAALPDAPATPPPAPEPLSLDDPPPARRFPLRKVAVVAAVTVALAAATFVILGLVNGRFGKLGTGRIPESAWADFTPPDGGWAASLPGRPAEEAWPGGAAGAGRRYVVTPGWFSGATAWVAWRELEPDLARKAVGDQAWVALRPAFDAERERAAAEWGGKFVREATVQFADPLTVELQLDTPRGRLVQRTLVVTDPRRRRVYTVGLVAPNLDPAGASAKRLFDSFRVNHE